MSSLHHPARLTLAALAGLVLALAALVVGAPAAQAHTVLESTDPAAGSTVPVVPEIITLTFTEPVLAVGTTIVVNAFDQRTVNVGPPVLVDNTVSQAVTGELPAGEYTVLYRVTSADGHPIEDQFRFTAAEGTSYGVATPAPTTTGPPTTTASPTTTPSTTMTPSPTPSEPPAADARVSGAALAAVAAVLLVAAGVVVWLLLRRREPPGSLPGSPSSSSAGLASE